MIEGLGLNTAAHCPTLIAMELGCMGCEDELAVGHTTVVGGPWDDRVLVILGPQCLGSDGDSATARVKLLLAHYATEGLLSLHDLGPGPRGAPEVRHGDHLDPIPQRC